MTMISPILVLVGVVGMLNVSMADDSSTTNDFPSALQPTIDTTLEPVVSVLMQFLSPFVPDVTRQVALLLVVLKIVLKLLAGFGYNVQESMRIMSSCYKVAEADFVIKALLDQLFNDIKKVLSNL